MPGFNGTGPMGEGPMSGGGFGRCNPDMADRGFGFRGRGLGRGFARGYGRGFGPGRGRGYRAAFRAFPPAPRRGNESETVFLKSEAEYLRQRLDEIGRRIDEISAVETKS